MISLLIAALARWSAATPSLSADPGRTRASFFAEAGTRSGTAAPPLVVSASADATATPVATRTAARRGFVLAQAGVVEGGGGGQGGAGAPRRAGRAPRGGSWARRRSSCVGGGTSRSRSASARPADASA